MKSVSLLVLVGICICGSVKVIGNNRFDGEDDSQLQLYYVENAQQREAVCNDGTDSGFYFRKGASGVTKWEIHLQGGWWCWDTKTCADRWNTSTILMTNKLWSQQISVDGIFSTSSTNNPDFYNANAVYIPYCSSDSWSGDIGKDDQGQWDFRGKKIVKAVIEDLTNDFSLNSASEVIFSGTSAGGQGVIVNVDFVNQLLAQIPTVKNYAGVADAGWMQNIEPLYPSTVSIETQFRLGIQYWNGQVDTDCATGNPGNEWMCFVSPYAYPYIQSHVLIQTEQYDSFQVPYDCCSPPFSSGIQQAKVDSIRAAFLSSLGTVKNPSTVFSAACYQHGLVENSLFWTIGIDGMNMRDVLGNWFFGRNGTTRAVDDCKGYNCSQNCS